MQVKGSKKMTGKRELFTLSLLLSADKNAE
jgi:hypothetical protein